MTFSLLHAAAYGSALVAMSGLVQVVLGLAAARAFMPRRRAALPRHPVDLPKVTVLKPLHGDEPLLAQALESFFLQDYRAVQLVFGVQNAGDPAIAIVERLCRQYPRSMRRWSSIR